MDLSPEEFDEAHYLAAYPDVAAEVAAGRFASGREHFESFGRQEGRRGAATGLAAVRAGVAASAEANVAGRAFAAAARWGTADKGMPAANPPNALQKFFDERREGRGIWKWRHYFEIYDRHFARFRGREVHVLEIGVFSGGSLELWRDYFGPRTRLYGVDIEPACRAYEGDAVQIFIGDQADRDFWRRFRAKVPRLDIVIDDGGHLYAQQRVTLEELLPHVQPGGVYVCEDIHGEFHPFSAYVSGLAAMLHQGEVTNHPDDPERRLASRTSAFQAAVGSVSIYPQLVVIEKHAAAVNELVAPQHGTQWQPFLR